VNNFFSAMLVIVAHRKCVLRWVRWFVAEK